MTIVLLHGATSSRRAWDDVIPAIESQHKVLAPTLAGHLGGRPMVAQPPQVVDSIVDDMCAHLDALDVDSAHLVGNSLGGWVALEMARRGRAKSVLALSPAGASSTSADRRGGPSDRPKEGR
ncbi:Soluble epoxide hydrolase [Mycobacterium sp. THAF192]|nr:Soluble epoxide hydrolase [Mycobacterium sp. THAF192]